MVLGRPALHDEQVEVLAGGRLAAHLAGRIVLGHENGGAGLGMQDRCALGRSGTSQHLDLALLSFLHGKKEASGVKKTGDP